MEETATRWERTEWRPAQRDGIPSPDVLAMPRFLIVPLAAITILFLTSAPAPGQTEAPAVAPEKSPGPGLVGQWSWSWKDADGATHRHVLIVEGMPPRYAARERFDDLPPVAVTRLVVDGQKIGFTVQRDGRTATYNGQIADADTINGEVNVSGDNGQAEKFAWTAKRAPKINAAPEEPPTPPAEGENSGKTGMPEQP